MKPRLLSALAFLGLLLCGVVYFGFFHDPGVGPMEPNGNGSHVEAEGRTESMKSVAEAAAEKGADRKELRESRAGKPEAVEFDPFYRKSLSGFRGRVLTHEKEPAANRLVRFYRIDPAIVIQNPGMFHLEEGADHVSPRIEVHEGRTGDDGSFQVTGAWAQSMYICEADAEGDNITRIPVQRAPGPGEIVDLGDIVLQLHGTISGRVVDDEGEPLANALVRAADIPGTLLDLAPVHYFDVGGVVIVRERGVQLVAEIPQYAKDYFELIPIPMTRTDADGEFKLVGVMPGMNVLAVNTDHVCRSTNASGGRLGKNLAVYLDKQVRVEPGQDKNVGRIRLKEGEYVEGKVLDEAGEPVANAEVVVGHKIPLSQVPFAFGYHMGPTKSDGVFSGTGFPRGQVIAAARARPGDPWVILEPKSVDDDLIIQVPSKHAVTLRLKSAGRMPKEPPEFRLAPSNGDSEMLDIVTMGMVKWLDVDGRTKQLRDGRYQIRNLPKGRYDLAVFVKGYGVGRLQFELSGDAEHEITLEPATGFRVLVTDTTGKPIQNAAIYAQVRRDWNRRKELVHNMPLSVGRTGKDGVLLVKDLQHGTVRLSASHPAYGFAHVQTKTPDMSQVTIEMETPGSISGRVTENGGLPKVGKWSVLVSLSRNGSTRGAMPDLPRLTTPDMEGKFTVKALRPGKYRVQVMQSVDVVRSPGTFISHVMKQQMTGQEVTRKEVEVTSGASEFVEIEAVKAAEIAAGPHALVTGSVTMNGRPAAGVLVSGNAGRRWFRKTADANGNFDLGPVPEGEMQVRIQEVKTVNMFDQRRGPTLFSGQWVIKNGENRHLAIVVNAGSAAGVVLRADGFPAKKVHVQAHGLVQAPEGGKPGSHNQSANTDANGRFEFSKMPAGKYTFSVTSNQGAGRLLDVEVAGGVPTDSLSLRLSSVGRVSGSVAGPNGAPVGEAYIQASGKLVQEGVKEPRWHHANARTDKAGRFTFEGLPVGEYTFSVRSGQGAGKIKAVVGSEGRNDLNVRLERVYKVSGTMDLSLFGDNKPQYLWISASLKDKGRSHQGWGSVDPTTGKFTIQSLAPGSYSLNVQAFPNPFDRSKDGRLVLPDLQVLGQDSTGLHLQPVLEKPQPRKPKPRKPDKSKD